MRQARQFVPDRRLRMRRRRGPFHRRQMNVNIDGADRRIHRIWAGIAILALTLAAYANSPSALAQAGSTGGTIGKQDKSASGSTAPEEIQQPTKRHKPRHSVVNPGDEASGSQSGSCRRIIGTWIWNNGVKVIVNSNKTTTQSDGNSATIDCTDGTYSFTWFGIATVRMSLSSDRNRLSGPSLFGPASAV